MRALWNGLCDLNSTQLAVSGAEEGGAQRSTATIGQLLHIGCALHMRRILEGWVLLAGVHLCPPQKKMWRQLCAPPSPSSPSPSTPLPLFLLHHGMP